MLKTNMADAPEELENPGTVGHDLKQNKDEIYQDHQDHGERY